ncbi:unnamed protein product [Rhizoctonia solani]|uniref:Laminin domain protein n=1 Tax=Rhizoctonia solani TaxID=456999 RepID=A0A8H2Y0X8_9AGAM|nr:unnamed protein product [Rhizoctonia solani]
MADHPGWYPPGQVCHPPELPTYLNNVYNLKPIVGVPNDAEVIGIHTVLHAARKASEIPGMHDPGLLMGLADHLFGAQMARYRSKYSLIAFPSDATYSPPTLPTHISVKLEPASGAPTDEEMAKAQDVVLTYQEMRRFPSIFDAHVNMELSQHLFDLQMARYMRLAGESQPILVPDAIIKSSSALPNTAHTPTKTEESTSATNNAGTGAENLEIHHTFQSVTGIDIHGLMERSNQLAERFNQLLERSNELLERYGQPFDQSSSPTLPEQFNQVLERLTQMMERSHPAEQSNQLVERFNQLLERFNQMVEQSKEPAQRANELAEQSNNLADGANQLAEKLNQSFERSNQLSEQANQSMEAFGGLLKNINKVLVGVQHAIVRNHKGNTVNAINCLVNEKGDLPGLMDIGHRSTVNWLSGWSGETFPVTIDGVSQTFRIHDSWLGSFLRFYSVCDHLRESATGIRLKEGKVEEARNRLSDYLTSCLG